MKILVISLAGIGDTLIATPLIHELRLCYPEAVLDALVLWPGARDLLAGNRWLSRVHQHNFLASGSLASVAYLAGLRRERYDISINTHPQSKVHYRWAAWMIGARLRLSHIYDNSGWLDRRLMNRLVPQDYAIHSIDNNLRLLNLLGQESRLPDHGMEIFLDPEEVDRARQHAAGLRERSRWLIGVHAGSGRTKNLALKRWPLDHWIALLKRVLKKLPEATVLLFGGPEEREENARILGELVSPRVVTPPTRSIREAVAWQGQCDAFVSVDNALMHAAVAMKVPRQVVIESPTFGPTLAPYRRPYALVKNPAVHGRNLEFYRYDGRGIRGSRAELVRFMEAVTPEAVFEVLAGTLAAGHPV